MAVNIEYCLDDEGNGSPCLKVYDGSNLIVHAPMEYPYSDIPTSGLTTLISDLRVLYTNALNDALTAADDQISRTSWAVQDFGQKLAQLITIRSGRSDYTA